MSFFFAVIDIGSSAMELSVGISSELSEIIFAIIIFLMAAEAVFPYLKAGKFKSRHRHGFGKEKKPDESVFRRFNIGLLQNTLRSATPLFWRRWRSSDRTGRNYEYRMDGMILIGAFCCCVIPASVYQCGNGCSDGGIDRNINSIFLRYLW